METKRCAKCEEWLPIEKFHNKAAHAGAKKYRQNACYRCRGNAERARLKMSMVDALGGKCNCCGERNPYFLSLDHVNNDGWVDKQELTSHQILRKAAREKYDSSKWQLLCMNCNFAKGHFGVCPHSLGIDADMATARFRDAMAGVGRVHVNLDPKSFMQPGFDARRMQLNRRALKPCPFCGDEFGTHELARHKREKHVAEVAARRAECLAIGRRRLYGA